MVQLRERAAPARSGVVKDCVIVGAPTFGRDVQELGIEGTRILKCELCGQPTFFAPSSFNHPKVIIANATFACITCAMGKLTPETEIAGPTEAQLREVAKALGGRRP